MGLQGGGRGGGGRCWTDVFTVLVGDAVTRSPVREPEGSSDTSKQDHRTYLISASTRMWCPTWPERDVSVALVGLTIIIWDDGQRWNLHQCLSGRSLVNVLMSEIINNMSSVSFLNRLTWFLRWCCFELWGSDCGIIWKWKYSGQLPSWGRAGSVSFTLLLHVGLCCLHADYLPESVPPGRSYKAANDYFRKTTDVFPSSHGSYYHIVKP